MYSSSDKNKYQLRLDFNTPHHQASTHNHTLRAVTTGSRSLENQLSQAFLPHFPATPVGSGSKFSRSNYFPRAEDGVESSSPSLAFSNQSSSAVLCLLPLFPVTFTSFLGIAFWSLFTYLLCWGPFEVAPGSSGHLSRTFEALF